MRSRPIRSQDLKIARRQDFIFMLGGIALLFVLLVLIPILALLKQGYEPPSLVTEPFPVTVDPRTKTISEDPAVEVMLSSASTLTSALWFAGDALDVLASRITRTPLYSVFASVGAPNLVLIEPGFRKEEIAAAFGDAIGWSAASEEAFLTLRENDHPELSDGSFSPGVYVVPEGMAEDEAQMLIDERFKRQILARYPDSTMEIVPLDDALTMASIIQRETGDREEMRVISGILWNRIFSDMRLQVDATLQYAKATENGPSKGEWWPRVAPRDKFIESPYNTYLNEGLPPSPIANPSISAVIAALNPKKTDCFFYFHDRYGGFHCSPTYEEHVALLKKHFGRGK